MLIRDKELRSTVYSIMEGTEINIKLRNWHQTDCCKGEVSSVGWEEKKEGKSEWINLRH